MVELRKRPAREDPPALPARKKSGTGGGITTKAKAVVEKVKEKVAGGPQVTEKTAQKNGSAPVAATSKPSTSVGSVLDLEGFGGEIKTQDDKAVTLKQLVSESEKGVVLFTYPKASTPGCTKQACLFRDAYSPITSAGLSIYGLSTDSPKSNTTFKTKQNLQYPLLCDPSSTLISAIGFHKAPKSTTRGVFVITKEGKIVANEPGGPAATVDVVRKVVSEMGGSLDGLPTKADAKDIEMEDDANTAAEVADTAAKIDSA